MITWLLVCYDNNDKTVTNIAIRGVSKTEAISKTMSTYPNFSIINIIEL